MILRSCRTYRHWKVSLSASRETVAYAEEVYAACATVGFHNGDVARLKAMLDAVATAAADGIELARVAQEVQRQAVAWAGGAR